MKILSTRTHGILDYLSAGVLYALPRGLGWNDRLTRLLTGAAVGTLVYSLLTRYEFGLFKVLPMKAHLALDGIEGAVLCAAPRLLLEEEANVTATVTALGIFSLVVPLITEPTPSGGE